MANLKYTESLKIVLFDGVCNMCNATINFCLAWNSQKSLSFAALQSDIGIALLEKYNIPNDLTTIVFLDEGVPYTHSGAALRIISYLDMPLCLMYSFVIVPPFLRDCVYNIVGKYRYAMFGKYDVCVRPDSDVRARFLDWQS